LQPPPTLQRSLHMLAAQAVLSSLADR